MSTHKLCDDHGDILGTLTVPDEVSRMLDEQRNVSIPTLSRLPSYALMEAPSKVQDSPNITTLHIRKYYGRRDAITAHGLSLYEIEKMEGFSFAPGVAYLHKVARA